MLEFLLGLLELVSAAWVHLENHSLQLLAKVQGPSPMTEFYERNCFLEGRVFDGGGLSRDPGARRNSGKLFASSPSNTCLSVYL